jgi:exopolyphosphatase / guanosine-5'-triphosphate,3'-diphosphate pyrophosphatase
MLRAAIDLGTNTCLLLIVEWDDQNRKIKRIVGDYSSIVRLGEGVDSHRMLQKASMERTIACLETYYKEIRKSGVLLENIVCVATSQARDGTNSRAFFDEIESKFGFKFKTLSGLQEARATFTGALLPGMDPSTSWVIDIGGGSTEIMSLSEADSMDIGAVRLTERFLKSDPVTDEEFWTCQDFIDKKIEEYKTKTKRNFEAAIVIAVAGTATTLAAWHLELKSFDQEKINQLSLKRTDVHRMMEELKWRTSNETRQIPMMEPGRADIILAGSMILWRIMEILGIAECRVSTQGLRFGVLGLIEPKGGVHC